MSGPLNTDALIHDLAIVLHNALHPNAQIGPSGRMASRRLRDVLGIEDGERTAVTEGRILAALSQDKENAR